MHVRSGSVTSKKKSTAKTCKEKQQSERKRITCIFRITWSIPTEVDRATLNVCSSTQWHIGGRI